MIWILVEISLIDLISNLRNICRNGSIPNFTTIYSSFASNKWGEGPWPPNCYTAVGRRPTSRPPPPSLQASNHRLFFIVPSPTSTLIARLPRRRSAYCLLHVFKATVCFVLSYSGFRTNELVDDIVLWFTYSLVLSKLSRGLFISLW